MPHGKHVLIKSKATCDGPSESSDAAAPQPPDEASGSGSQKQKRQTVACTRCRKRKIRCEGDPHGNSRCKACALSDTDPRECVFSRVNTYEIGFNTATTHVTYDAGHGSYVYFTDPSNPGTQIVTYYPRHPALPPTTAPPEAFSAWAASYPPPPPGTYVLNPQTTRPHDALGTLSEVAHYARRDEYHTTDLRTGAHGPIESAGDDRYRTERSHYTQREQDRSPSAGSPPGRSHYSYDSRTCSQPPTPGLNGPSRPYDARRDSARSPSSPSSYHHGSPRGYAEESKVRLDHRGRTSAS